MKNLQKLGKVLSTKEQKNVNGGMADICDDIICPKPGEYIDIDSFFIAFCCKF